MKNLLKFTLLLSLIIFLPIITSAATTNCDTITGLGNLLCKFNELLNSVVPVLMALGMVYFVWGVVTYVIASDEEAKKTGKNRIIYGIIGFVVITAMWGLVNIVVTTLGVGGQSAPHASNLVSAGVTSGCTSISTGSDLSVVFNYFTCIIGNSVIPLIFALAMLMFIWGAVKFFIVDADEEAKRAQGKQFMVWGVIALAVMISVWGLVSIIGVTFGLDTKILPQTAPRP